MNDVLSRIETADIAVAKATAPVEETVPGSLLGKLGKLGDQPPLIALALATAAAGVLRDDPRLARTGVRMLAAHTLATAVKALVKARVTRSRPSLLIERGHYEARAEGGGDHDMTSFPSGHTAGLTAVARAFSREYPKRAGGAITGALGLSLIQIPRRAHFVSDVAAGAVIGVVAEAMVSAVSPQARAG